MTALAINRDIYIALGAFPARSIEEAMLLSATASEPFFGRISSAHVQICPQNPGVLTMEYAREIVSRYPDTQFRLHANARVEGWNSLADLSAMNVHHAYFNNLAVVSHSLGAEAYTLHAGNRALGSLKSLESSLHRLEDLFGCRVGVEGLYPTDNHRYWIDSWDEYAYLLKAGCDYAIDLSHLNILAHKSGIREYNLIQELVSSDKCIEVHISDNDGSRDTHLRVFEEPWWFDCLSHTHKDAVIFTEGCQTKHA